jgi:hypothetical protein
MNPTAKRNRSFCSYRYSSAAANSLWTLGWATAAALAIRRCSHTGDESDFINALVTLAVALFGGVMTVRAIQRMDNPGPPKDYPKEPFLRRITGCIGVIVWGGIGILWNLATWSILFHAARDGNTPLILIMVLFSAIGWFLLVTVCVFVTMTLDSIIEKITNLSKRLPVPPRIDGKYPPQS